MKTINHNLCNLVFSIALAMLIGHPKRVSMLTSQALALSSVRVNDEGLMLVTNPSL